jgi:hypothetical protein
MSDNPSTNPSPSSPPEGGTPGGAPGNPAAAVQTPAQLLAATLQQVLLNRPNLPYAPAPAQLVLPGFQPIAAQQTMQVWQGQFPPPDAIERYEKVLPGCFDRLLKMAENQITIQAKETRHCPAFRYARCPARALARIRRDDFGYGRIAVLRMAARLRHRGCLPYSSRYGRG